MDINNHNYEEFAIDYLEGNLSPELEEAMQLFLLQNPEIEAELMGLEEMVLEVDTDIVFPDKKVLLQSEKPVKVIPLYRQWKRYVLPMAGALCLFFVWQVLLLQDGYIGNGVEIVGAGESKMEEKGNLRIDGSEKIGNVNVADLEGKNRGVEEERVNNSEMEYNLKPKVDAVSSIAGNTPSTSNAKNQNGELKRRTSRESTSKIAAKDEGAKPSLVSENEVFNEDNRKEVLSFAEDSNLEKEPYKMNGFEGQKTENEAIVVVKDKKEKRQEKERRKSIVLATLPTQSSAVTGESIEVVSVDFRELPQTQTAIADVATVESKNQKSTFLNNLKKAITPEIFSGDEMDESSTGSEVLVAISLKPNQHDFIKKIFKNNK